jgi:hypothetical protein
LQQWQLFRPDPADETIRAGRETIHPIYVDGVKHPAVNEEPADDAMQQRGGGA